MQKLLQKKIALIIFLTLLWRAIILFIPLFISSQTTHNLFTLNNWTRWDAPHYLYIAQHWYTSQGDPANLIVFPPLYPIILKCIDLIVNNPTISGIIISNTFFILGSIIFYILIKNEFDQKVAVRSLILLNVFPTSYFFSIPYTESLFFFLIVLSFYLLKRNKFYQANLIAALTFLARTMGLILLPTLALTTAITKLAKKQKFLSWFTLLISFFITISSYLLINKLVLGNFFAFQAILKNNWYKHLDFPWVSITNNIGYLQPPFTHNSLMLGFFEIIPATLGILLIPLAVRKLKFQYSIYYIFSILLITSTSFLQSTLRYFLSIPPLFILLGILTSKKWIYYPLVIIFLSLLTYFSLLFVSGQWAF